MNYQYIFFDLDGTIIESGPGVTASVAYALEKLGKKALPEETLKKFIGPPLKESFMRFSDFSEEEVDLGIQLYREHYEKDGLFNCTLYEGIVPMMKVLKDAGKTIALTTSKPAVYAQRLVEYFELTPYVDYVAGASMDEKKVEKAEIIEEALQHFQIKEEDKAKVRMVGDREYDVYGAKENGILTTGVLYGYGSSEELLAAGADSLAETPMEVAVQLVGADR